MSGPVDVLSTAGRRALTDAARRERANVCPIRWVNNAPAETMLLRSLAARGFITSEPAPRITDAGRAAIAAVQP